MGWDIGCYVFGAISIVGPILLIVWYLGAAKEQVRKLNEKKDS